jgi:hypothetical protein
MVAPRASLEAVARAIANSGELPSDMGLVMREADVDSDDSDVDVPALEVQTDEVENVVIHNSDLTDYIVDDDGNRVGRVYTSDYEMTLSLSLWTTEGDGYTPNELGQALRNALYQYSSYGPDRPLLDEEGAPLDDIYYFRIGDGQRADDLIRNPTVRRWEQEVELWAYEDFRTTEDYIATVDFPASGDFADTDGDGQVDNT